MRRTEAVILLLAILLVVFKCLQATVTHDDPHHRVIKEKLDSYFFNRIVSSVLHHNSNNNQAHQSPIYPYGNGRYEHQQTSIGVHSKHLLIPHTSDIRTQPSLRIVLHRISHLKSLLKHHNSPSCSHDDSQIPITHIPHYPPPHKTKTIIDAIVSPPPFGPEFLKRNWTKTPAIEVSKGLSENHAGSITVDKVFQNVLNIISNPSAAISGKEILDGQGTKLTRELVKVNDENVVTADGAQSWVTDVAKDISENFTTERYQPLLSTERDSELVKSFSQIDHTTHPSQEATTGENSIAREVNTEPFDGVTLVEPPLSDTKLNKISFLNVEEQQKDGEIAEEEIYLLARELESDDLQTTTEAFSGSQDDKLIEGAGFTNEREQGGSETKLGPMRDTSYALLGKGETVNTTQDDISEERKEFMDPRDLEDNETGGTGTTNTFVGKGVTVDTAPDDISAESKGFMSARELEGNEKEEESMMVTIAKTDSFVGTMSTPQNEAKVQEKQQFEGTTSGHPADWEPLNIAAERGYLSMTDGGSVESKNGIVSVLPNEAEELLLGEGSRDDSTTLLNKEEELKLFTETLGVGKVFNAATTEASENDRTTLGLGSPERQTESILGRLYSANTAFGEQNETSANSGPQVVETTGTPGARRLDGSSEQEDPLKSEVALHESPTTSERQVVDNSNSGPENAPTTVSGTAGEERIIMNSELETDLEGIGGTTTFTENQDVSSANVELTEEPLRSEERTGTPSDEMEINAEDGMISTTVPDQVKQYRNLIYTPISSTLSTGVIDPSHRRSDVIVADEYSDQSADPVNLDPEDLLHIIPIVVRELRNDAISPQEQDILANVYGDLWPNIIQLVHSRDLDVEAMLQDPSALKSMLDPVMFQQELPGPLIRKTRHRDYMESASDYMEETVPVLIDYSEESVHLLPDYSEESGSVLTGHSEESGSILTDYSEESGSVLTGHSEESGSILTGHSEEFGSENYSYEEDTGAHVEADVPELMALAQAHRDWKTHRVQGPCRH